MRLEWLQGERKPAETVWRRERSHAGMLGLGLLIVCPFIASCIPGSGAGIWLLRTIVGLFIPILTAVVWHYVEKSSIRVPDVLVGVSASELGVDLITREIRSSDDYGEGKYTLSRLRKVLWTLGTCGSFEWPLYDGNHMVMGQFEVEDTRIRLAGTRPIPDEVAERVARNADLFDQIFPHPTVAVDSVGGWIVYDPDGRLLDQ